MARLATNDGGTTTTRDHSASSLKHYCSGPHIIRTTRPSRPGTTGSGLANALGLTNTLWALQLGSTELGRSDDYHQLTGTTENCSRASPRLPGRLTALARHRHRSSYYPEMTTTTTSMTTMERTLRNRPLNRRNRLRSSSRNNRLQEQNGENYQPNRHQPPHSWTTRRLQRPRPPDLARLHRQAALTTTRSDASHHK